MGRVRLIGRGRAGLSLAAALSGVGWSVLEVLGRREQVVDAARSTDALVIATPDASVSEVSRSVDPVPGTVVMHLAGSLGLDALGPHDKRASLHPLVALPDAEVGAARLVGACFAVAGDPLAWRMAWSLRGTAFAVPDEHRSIYHAAACSASNHLVALLGQVERLAAAAGLPLAAFLPLARGALQDVAAKGPGGALTGPVSRGDWETVERHRLAMDPGELEAYDALAALAGRLREEPVTCS